MDYKLNIKKTGYNKVEIYGTPKKDKKGIRAGQDMWMIARHIWGTKENSQIVKYENVVPFPESSIVINFVSGSYLENYRRAKLLISVYKFARKNIPIIEAFFPKRNDNNKINEDYDSIITQAATLFKKYNVSQIKSTTSNLRMLDKALNQEPSTKLLSKPNKKDSVEKVISKMLIEDVVVINKITDILTNTLYVDERGDLKTIGGKEKANKSIRKIIKKEFLKRYKVTK